tara:strand:+ start:4513 stop:5424 length:912 start_codon:yes stop_codon:yes gene_type:complete
MRILVISLLFVAVIAAAGTAALVKGFLESQQGTGPENLIVEEMAPAPEKITHVLVAKAMLLPGDEISTGDILFKAWPEDMLDKNYVVSETPDNAGLADFVGTTARVSIPSGVPLTREMVFRRSEAGFLTGILSPGMRAVSVAVQPQTGASGFIMPGDYVDVIVTYNFTAPEEGQGSRTRQAAETILEEVRVVAVDQELQGENEEAIVAKTITLEVTPKGAETISLGTMVGKIHLSLRSLSAVESKEQEVFTPDYEIFEALTIVVEEEEELELGNTYNAPTPSGPKIKVYRGGTESVNSLPGQL